MRALPMLLLLAAIAACRSEPSFDERFESTANEIQERAANLDAQVNEAEAVNENASAQP